jgi:hypothetical protein
MRNTKTDKTRKPDPFGVDCATDGCNNFSIDPLCDECLRDSDSLVQQRGRFCFELLNLEDKK